MPVIFAGLFSAIGGIFSGLFSFKSEQAKTVQSALEVLKSVNDVDGTAATASAQALSTILSQGSFLEKNWRPIFMVICMVILIAAFFGHYPSHLNDPVTPTMQKIWTMLEIGLGGYMPLRTLEKIVTMFNVSGILKALIAKKVL